MIKHDDHPFKPGVKVAVISAYGTKRTFREDEVAKVHKTGRFSLQQTGAQWRVEHGTITYGGPRVWYAEQPAQSGRRFRDRVRVLDESFLAEIEVEKAEEARRTRVIEAVRTAEKFLGGRSQDRLTDWQLEALETFNNLCKEH